MTVVTTAQRVKKRLLLRFERHEDRENGQKSHDFALRNIVVFETREGEASLVVVEEGFQVVVVDVLRHAEIEEALQQILTEMST